VEGISRAAGVGGKRYLAPGPPRASGCARPCSCFGGICSSRRAGASGAAPRRGRCPGRAPARGLVGPGECVSGAEWARETKSGTSDRRAGSHATALFSSILHRPGTIVADGRVVSGHHRTVLCGISSRSPRRNGELWKRRNGILVWSDVEGWKGGLHVLVRWVARGVVRERCDEGARRFVGCGGARRVNPSCEREGERA
jgi:hypothetical protein